jgi:hypothetical protein
MASLEYPVLLLLLLILSVSNADSTGVKLERLEDFDAGVHKIADNTLKLNFGGRTRPGKMWSGFIAHLIASTNKRFIFRSPCLSNKKNPLQAAGLSGYNGFYS